jgi:hypothetical protein
MPRATSSGGDGDVALRAPRHRGRRQIMLRTADSETAPVCVYRACSRSTRVSFNQCVTAFVPSRAFHVYLLFRSAGGYRPG